VLTGSGSIDRDTSWPLAGTESSFTFTRTAVTHMASLSSMICASATYVVLSSSCSLRAPYLINNDGASPPDVSERLQQYIRLDTSVYGKSCIVSSRMDWQCPIVVDVQHIYKRHHKNFIIHDDFVDKALNHFM